MALTYTTTQAIARRLQGRLNIPTNGFAEPWTKNLGEMVANEELISQIGEQKEAYVNSILRRIYTFPLALVERDTRAILAEIVENLIVADLMGVYYQSSPSPQLGNDISGLGTNSANRASQLLGLYCAGHNLAIPGVTSQQPNMEAVVLPGEQLQFRPPDTLTRNQVFVGNRRVSGELADIDFGIGSVRRRRRPLGLEEPEY